MRIILWFPLNLTAMYMECQTKQTIIIKGIAWNYVTPIEIYVCRQCYAMNNHLICVRFVVRAPVWRELTLRIHYVQTTSSAGNGASTLALKPMGGVNQSPKQRVSVALQNGDFVTAKYLFKKTFIFLLGLTIQLSSIFLTCNYIPLGTKHRVVDMSLVDSGWYLNPIDWELQAHVDRSINWSSQVIHLTRAHNSVVPLTGKPHSCWCNSRTTPCIYVTWGIVCRT